MALGADERRGKLRKASGRRKQPSIRRYLNGETYLSKPQVSIRESIAYGRERCELKHLSSSRRRKRTRFPKERRANGKEAKPKDLVLRGCGLQLALLRDRRMVLGKPAVDGESPVDEILKQRAGSRVPRDTRNLVGSRGDHPPSLNTP